MSDRQHEKPIITRIALCGWGSYSHIRLGWCKRHRVLVVVVSPGRNTGANVCVIAAHQRVLAETRATMLWKTTAVPFFRYAPSHQTFVPVSVTSPLALPPPHLPPIWYACGFAYNIRRLRPNLSEPNSSCKHSKCVILTNIANRTNNMHSYTSPGDPECTSISHFWSTEIRHVTPLFVTLCWILVAAHIRLKTLTVNNFLPEHPHPALNHSHHCASQKNGAKGLYTIH